MVLFFKKKKKPLKEVQIDELKKGLKLIDKSKNSLTKQAVGEAEIVKIKLSAIEWAEKCISLLEGCIDVYSKALPARPTAEAKIAQGRIDELIPELMDLIRSAQTRYEIYETKVFPKIEELKERIYDLTMAF